MDDSVEELYQSIEDALEGSSPDQFFPDSELETVLSEESVRAALKYLLEERKKLRKPEQEPSNQSFIDNLTKFVLEKANKIFGILVMVGAPWHIQRFYSNGLGNNVLPVAQHRQDPQDRRGRHTGRLVTVRPLETENQDQDRVSVQTVGEIFSSVPTNNSNVPAWNSPEITSFCNTWQWAFLAPVFKSGEFSKKLSSDIRLPYTTYEAPESQSMDSEKHRNGGFGDVQDRCIHHDHLEFPKEVCWRRRLRFHSLCDYSHVLAYPTTRFISRNLLTTNHRTESHRLHRWKTKLPRGGQKASASD